MVPWIFLIKNNFISRVLCWERGYAPKEKTDILREDYSSVEHEPAIQSAAGQRLLQVAFHLTIDGEHLIAAPYRTWILHGVKRAG